MLRILFVIPTLDRSGAEKQLALLASQLPRTEFSVRVVCLTRGGPYETLLREAEIPVDVLGKRWKFDPSTFWRLKRCIDEWRPDVVSSWLFAANSYVRLLARRTAAHFKVVVSERCVDSWKQGWQLWLDRRLASRTDRLVANSQSVAEFYARHGILPQKIVVIPNGVEVPPLPHITREQLLSELNLPIDARVVAHVGRLAPQKRLRDLLWGMQVLRQVEPRACLLVIGDGPERSELEQYARSVEVQDHVRFLGHRDDAPSLLHLIDVFWLASEFEGMSNSLMEAMACGIPVVATSIPPNRELITHGEHGWLVNVGDGPGFAQFTLKLWREPEEAARLAQQARLRMETEFSIPLMVRRYAELFRQVAGE